MSVQAQISRRAFLKTSAAVGGGLLLSFTVPGSSRRALAADAPKPNPLAAWVRIQPDNTVTLVVPGSEMGQGIDTALPMLLAEELEADWKTVRMSFAEANPVYINPGFGFQATGGSATVRSFSEPLRRVGATARTMLVEAAAQKWGVPASQCVAEHSTVLHKASGRKATYGELASAAAQVAQPASVTLKKPAQWKLLGKPVKRLDTYLKSTGRAQFGIDVKVPGMLVATLTASPAFGGKLKHVDDKPALAKRGVKAVVPLTGVPFLDDAVVVVADTYWNALQGLRALDIQWDPGANGAVSDATLWEGYRAGLKEAGAPVQSEGDAAGAIAGAAKKVKAVYEFPYLAHATMEPMNATAHVKADGVDIWAPTQSPGLIQNFVAQALQMKPEQVHVTVTFLGGGFGRRFELDTIFRAVFASKAVGAPVKVLWSREEDMRHDFYRPATAIWLNGGLDGAGKVTGVQIKSVNSSIMARVFPQMVKDGVDHLGMEGLENSPYGFPARQVNYLMKNTSIPVGFWRSVANTYSGFAMESYMDELAHAAGKDPVRFRLDLLKAKPRHAAVLEQVARLGNWGKSMPKGMAQGVALHESFGSIVGEVVEVSLKGQEYKVHKVACVVDCGLTVNPDTINAQMHSCIAYGLTAAQYGEINIEAGAVKQANFPDYQIVKLAQMPAVDVHIMQNEEPHGGIGEPGTPPIAPAVANALFTLTGQRIRSLPLAKHGFTLV